MDPQLAAKIEWDVIVVGTGVGGATLGYALAKAGKRVLFCEKGRSHLNSPLAKVGRFAETFFDTPAAPGEEHADLLAHAGRWNDTVIDRTTSRAKRMIPFIGSGTGGSSALFGMAMERMHRCDFNPNWPVRDPESTLPDAWPIGYDEMRPWYQRAEALYGVSGEIDPLRRQDLDPIPPAPSLTPAASIIAQKLQDQGLHPYRLPSACRWLPQCVDCQGFLCPHACKNDAASVCLQPALNQHAASLIDQCRVVRIQTSGRKVSSIICQRNGQALELRGRVIALASGALETPCILLRSTSPEHRTGLANGSGMVGRNLMRHYVDLYSVRVGQIEGAGGARKEIAFMDWYDNKEGKLGAVQSFGALPPPHVILAQLKHDVRSSRWSWLTPLVAAAGPLIRRHLAKTFARAHMLATIVEDLPYQENHVRPGPHESEIEIEYRIRPSEMNRIGLMRKRMKTALSHWPTMLLKQAENNERLAHVCGTCRSGDDQRSSVCDRNNRAHELDNLYIVDASYFPSSSGANPALTIAANALRVASTFTC